MKAYSCLSLDIKKKKPKNKVIPTISPLLGGQALFFVKNCYENLIFLQYNSFIDKIV